MIPIQTMGVSILTYTHVIWDFDGTLYDTYPSMASAFTEALRERGVEESERGVMALMKISMDYALDQFRARYPVVDDALLHRYKQIRKADELQTAHPFDGIPALLGRIQGEGGHNYIFTHRGSTTHAFLGRDGLTGLFTDIITTEQHFPRKPDPAGILFLIEKYDMPKGSAVMVGDRALDILSGKNAGVATCFFDPGAAPLDIADVSCDNVAALAKALGY